MKLFSGVLHSVLFLVFSVIIFNNCDTEPEVDPGPVDVPVVISLDRDDLTMQVGEITSISHNINPDTIPVTDLQWTSSNSDVVTVSQDGKLKALSLGTAEITLRSQAQGAEDKLAVTVIPTALVEIQLEGDVIPAYIGTPKTLDVTFNPDSATDKTLTWESSDNTVVTVQDGTITAKKLGYVWVAAHQNQHPYDHAIIIPAMPGQLVAASQVNSTTGDQKNYIEVFVAGLSSVVTVNEITLYLGAKGSMNVQELRTLTPALTVSPGEGVKIPIEVNADEAYQLTFGRYLRLDVTSNGMDYYVYVGWSNEIEVVQQ